MSEVKQVSIARLEVFNEWVKLKHLKRNECCNGLEKYLINERNLNQRNIREILLKFLKNVEIRWKASYRDRARFETKNKKWLESNIIFSDVDNLEQTRSGRPRKMFKDCGTRAKQMKVNNLASTSSVEELSFATQMCLRKVGKRAAATVINEVTLTNSPKRANRYKSAYKTVATAKEKVITLRPEEALALIINSKSSKSTYLAYRMAAKGCNANIYPSWNKILSAKRECYPDQGAIKITDVGAEVKLEALLHLTAKRICQLQEDVLSAISSTRLTLVCKWGLDGSSGQSNYKQMTNAEISDSSIFIISLVPLQLRDSEDETKIVWQNPVPSSTRFCRAIKFIFAKETTDITQKETAAIQEQIVQLSDLLYKDAFTVGFKLVLTMVDGKVCHTLTNTKSTQSCYICNARPIEMNDLKNLEKKIAKIENYSFGVSSLHSWIRFFECCLHIGYRIEIKSWQARGANRHKMNNRKQQIIEGLRKELNILVDQPKPGYGSTNTGNIARIFFRNAKKSSEITGVDEEIIKRFHIILQTISCGYEVDSELFKNYTKETATLFVTKYPWFYMPTSVHKVLIYGAEIIKNAVLPIGQLGEEAQEAKNKEFKFVREHRSRKDSAEHTNEDLFNYFILSSDPLISFLSLKRNTNHNKLKLQSEAAQLLKSPSIPISPIDSDFSSSESN